VKIRQFVVDAFASKTFEGNPAAVCPLEYWLEEPLLQSIAYENNLSETAFFVKAPSGYELRWFTPVAEVALCGHATLASAHVLFEHLGFDIQTIHFLTRSGELLVTKNNDLLEMVFPGSQPKLCVPPKELEIGLGGNPTEFFAAEDYLVVYPNEQAIKNLAPDMNMLTKVDLRGIIITAPGESCDFVSRFFAPKLGVPEDPVTGSAHCQLAPYWAKRLGKNELQAIQVSKRRGHIFCTVDGEKVVLSGRAVTFLQGEIEVDI